ncbi:MAG: MFS transporter [Acidobacteria bacterium]|nr:MFS transporter [Acidobacteriota bacterium]
MAMLRVILPDRDIMQVPLSDAELEIGKSADNGLAIPDPTVSRKHAIIRREGEGYAVYDAGSRNGVFVNGTKLGPAGHPLKTGDVIQLGKVRITFGYQATAARPAPEAEPQSPPAIESIDVTMPGGKRVQVPVTGAEIGIGRADDNEIVLDDPTVSRKHAVLRRSDDVWRIFNIGRNAIFVNGRQVGEQGADIGPGDTVSVGNCSLEFVVGSQSSLRTVSGFAVPPVSRDDSTVAAPPDATDRISRPPEPAQPDSTYRLPPTTSSPQPPSSDRTDRISPPAPPPPPPAPPPPSASGYRVRKTGELIPVAPPRPDAPAASNAPIVLDGRYEIEGKIAEASTGTVYRAKRVLLGDKVAVKVLRPELVRDRMSVERFKRQAQVAARIRHPNSVQVFDFGTTPEGAVYLVEELLSGQTLRDLIRRERGLSVVRIVGLLNQICGAVHTAHVNGIVLRDVKPDSIYVEPGADGKEIIKVGGYGLAKLTGAAAEGNVTMAATARLFGSPEYMSPEQILDRQLDSRSDVYSLGCILYELLAGSPPFLAPTPAQVAEQQLYGTPPDLSETFRPDIDEGIEAVVNRALKKDPNYRQQTALQLAAEFEAVAGGPGSFARNILNKTGLLKFPVPAVAYAPAAVPAGEAVLPSVVAEEKSTGRGAFNPIVLALMAESFISKVSSGMVKTTVPLFALLIFGFDIASIMGLTLLQNIVPLLLRPIFGTAADKYGKKKVFMLALGFRTFVSVLYAIALNPIMFAGVSVVRGLADSAKGPSTSALIADSTDEKHIAQAYSWYQTIKSVAGGVGESVAAFVLTGLVLYFAGATNVTLNVAVLEETNKKGQQIEQILASPEEVSAEQTLPGTESHPEPFRVSRVEQRTVSLREVPIDDLTKAVEAGALRRALVTILLTSTFLSLVSFLLVWIVIKEEPKKEKKQKKQITGVANAVAEKGPPVLAFTFLGMALTAPAYMVTGEFFTILAVKLEVTPAALGWIKIIAETMVPLFVGPFFGWLADRIGASKVIALRSVANIATSALFYITPWFAGTALLGLMMGIARGVDEIGKAAFKPTWGAIAAKVSSFNLANRSKTMGTLEAGVDASDLIFPQLAGLLLQFLSLGWLMAVRTFLAIIAEFYSLILTKKYKI